MSKEVEYIDTGVNWLGKIPSTWESKRIKMLTRVKRGASPRPIDNPIYFDEEGEFAWVRIADVTASERYLENTTQRLSELGSSASVKRYPDDFFLSIAGTVGKPIITKIKCCIHDGFVYFPDLKINPEFLYYIFSTGLPYLGLGKMGTQLNLNTDTVGDIYIPIPDEKEIEKIVGYLDKRTAEIDSLITKKQKLIDCLREERMSIINQAVTKGTATNIEMKDSGIDWLGQIPKHWEVKKLKYVLAEIKGALKPGPFGSDLKNSDLTPNGEYKVYTQRNVIDNDFEVGEDFISEDKFQLLNVFEVNENDILISTRGTIGKSVIVPKEFQKGIIHPCLIRVTINQEIIFNKFLQLFFNESSYFLENVKLYSNSTIIEVIYGNTLREVFVPVPPKDEQIKITDTVEYKMKEIDNTIEKIGQEIVLINEYRTSLVNEVVTGKITMN
jgi:type I restriction enzyme S subunit